MARHLPGFNDLLQVDGYGAYRLSAKGLRAKDGVTLAPNLPVSGSYCASLHVNADDHNNGSTVEDRRGQSAARIPQHGESPLGKDRRIVARPFDLWETGRPRLSAKSSVD